MSRKNLPLSIDSTDSSSTKPTVSLTPAKQTCLTFLILIISLSVIGCGARDERDELPRQIEPAGNPTHPSQHSKPSAPARKINQFVHVSEKDPTRLVLDDGAPYLPIGINIGWTPDGTPVRPDTVSAYFESRFARCESNGINIVRVWLATWFINPETPGDLESLDAVFSAAQKHGIRVILALDNAHDIVHNPHRHPLINAIGKGFAGDRIEAYFSHPDARAAYQARCRLLIDRYADEPALAIWELCNEIDLTLTSLDDATDETGAIKRIETRADWVRVMTAFLKETDPARRPVTVSVSDWQGKYAALGRHPSIDIITPHEYLPATDAVFRPDQRDEYYSLAAIVRECLADNKPVICLEYGLRSSGATLSRAPFDPDGSHMRHFLWTSAFMPYAGPAFPWWWDDYIFGRRLDPLWRPLSDWRSDFNPAPGEKIVWLNNADDLNAPVLMTALKTETTAAGYIRSAALSWSNVLAAGERGERLVPGDIRRARIAAGQFPPGDYIAFFIRPSNGERLTDSQFIHTGGELIVPLPDFSDDLGFRIEKR
ncbi:MAG: cellulase family glycosylhydrolase [Planctomycetota bacterium]